jgi:hypothetical protein
VRFLLLPSLSAGEGEQRQSRPNAIRVGRDKTMPICMSCEKPFDECHCFDAAQKRIKELIAENRAKEQHDLFSDLPEPELDFSDEV